MARKSGAILDYAGRDKSKRRMVVRAEVGLTLATLCGWAVVMMKLYRDRVPDAGDTSGGIGLLIALAYLYSLAEAGYALSRLSGVIGRKAFACLCAWWVVASVPLGAFLVLMFRFVFP